MENNIVPIAMPGIHEKFYPYLKSVLAEYDNPRILEIGSGHGAFTKRIWEDGFDVHASDLYPENFYFDKVQCHKIDIRHPLPFDSDSFDVVVAVEVMEHVHDHETFFQECSRVLRKNGRLVFSTPNILSLKSRMSFLMSGFFYSFKPLDHANDNGLQHLASLTVDQYNNLGIRNGMKLTDISIDKSQSTSKVYLVPVYPLIRLFCWIKNINPGLHNTYQLLVGRILFINFQLEV